jgi:hypothetical protein
MSPELPLQHLTRRGWQRFLRFKLRTLFVLFTLLCVWLGLHSYDARKQATALKAIAKLRRHGDNSPPRIDYAHQLIRASVHDRSIEPIWPRWLLDLVGEDFFLRVDSVSLERYNLSNDELKNVINLPCLRYLDLEYTNASDESLALIADCAPNLNRLDLQVTQVTSLGLKHVARLSKLRMLLFGESEITDEDLSHLEALQDLEQLALRKTKIRGEGLGYLVGLPNLHSLDLSENPLTDSAIEPLAKMSQLKELRIIDTKLSEESLSKLKRALPNCKFVMKY